MTTTLVSDILGSIITEKYLVLYCSKSQTHNQNLVVLREQIPKRHPMDEQISRVNVERLIQLHYILQLFGSI